MKLKLFVLGLTFVLFSCQNSSRKRIVIQKITVNHIDLYPLYPGCNTYYEKNEQLHCLQEKIENFIDYSIQNKYKQDLLQLHDSLWINLSIDTLGNTKFINLKYADTLQNMQKYNEIFSHITGNIPQIKPAIYHDKPVIFNFTVPVVIKP